MINFYYSSKYILTLSILFTSFLSFSQATIKVTVTSVQTSGSIDCDGDIIFLPPNLSDFVWEYTATDNTLGYSNNFFYNWTVPNVALPWNIKGTNNKEIDKNFSLNTLYNWFYPNFKIILNKKTNYYNSTTDVNNLLSNPYDLTVYTPEFGRTHSFFYKSGTDFSNDIVISDIPNKYKWGMESSDN